MRSTKPSGRNSNDPRKSPSFYHSAFYRVINTYIECALLPHVGTATLDGSPKRVLVPGSTPLLYKLDTEISNKRVLTSPELRDEWNRIVRAEIRAPESPEVLPTTPTTPALPLSAKEQERLEEQQKLTARVIQMCGRLYVKRGLDKMSYFKQIKKRAEG